MKMVIVRYGKSDWKRWECRPDLSEETVKEFIDDDYFTIDDYAMVESKDAFLFAALLNYGCDSLYASNVIAVINFDLEKKGLENAR